MADSTALPLAEADGPDADPPGQRSPKPCRKLLESQVDNFLHSGISVLTRLAEKAVGRSLGDFGDPEDIAEAASFLASHR